MLDQLVTRGSRLLTLGGIAAVTFGVVALVWPGITLVALVLLFGAYALVGGVLTLVSGIEMATAHARHWVPLVLSGLVGTGIGVLTFFRPGITAIALVYLIALWAILTGILEFAAGVELTGVVRSAWTYWVGGLLSVAFGVVIALAPISGALAIVWLIGIYAIVLGITRIVFAYRMHDVKTDMEPAVRGRATATS